MSELRPAEALGSQVNDAAHTASGGPADQVRPGTGSPRRLTALAVLAAGCLVAAILAFNAAHAALTREPTAAQRSAAAAAAMAGRWRSWPAGKIFPSRLRYHTDLLTSENATRVGISADDSCVAAVEPRLHNAVLSNRCVTGLRATYLDQLQGVAYTVGVLAFPSARDASSFLGAASGQLFPLRTLALPGTASARFDDAARQAATSRQVGPFVVLTVAGYADGRPATAGGQPRPDLFVPGSQLASEIAGPLGSAVTVDCRDTRSWSC